MNTIESQVVDRYFYECLNKIERQVKSQITFFSFRTLALLVTVPLDHLVLSNNPNSNALTLFTLFLLAFLAINTLELFLNLYFYYAKLKSKALLLKIAEDFKHCRSLHDERFCKLEEEHIDDIESFEIEQKFGLNVSTEYYDYENLQKLNEVSEEFKSERQLNGENNIKAQIQKQILCYRPIYCLFQLFSFAIFVFGIVTSSITSINEPEHNILEFLLISEVLFKPKIYCLVFGLAALPFVLGVVCIYCCFCKRQKKAILPEKVKANAQIISKCSECAICFQSYQLEEQVIVLQCSLMHVFHQTCIKGWTNVKASCPICRKNLSEA